MKSERNESKFVNKTTAKKEYFLNEKDLNDMPCIQKRNPYNRDSKYSIKLYEKALLMEKMKTKYKFQTEQQHKNLIEKLSNQRDITSANLKQKKRSLQDKREFELTEILHRHGLELRSDSKLCEGYIKGAIKDKSLIWIANRMCEMKFLFEFCDMQSAFDETKEDYFDFMRIEGYTRFSLAEEAALEKVGDYPKIFPWLSTPNPQTVNNCTCIVCSKFLNE